MTERYKRARAAYEAERQRVIEESGSPTAIPYDFTGAFVSEDYLWKLAHNPTATEAAKFYEELLDYAENSGWSTNFDGPFSPTQGDET